MTERHRRRPWRLLAAAVLTGALLPLAGGAQPAAAAAVPWTCDASGYLFQSPNGRGTKPFTVQRVDLVTGANSLLGTTADSLNGVGYNTLDNYFYAWDFTTSQLARVNADLTLKQLGRPTGFPNTDVNIGDFDQAGHYFAANGNATPALWREVDFAPGSPTYGQVIGSGTLTPSAGGTSRPTGRTSRARRRPGSTARGRPPPGGATRTCSGSTRPRRR
ncbi:MULTISPECIES: hypothetical protein [Kitasatospora]|uniref:DUF6923 domain-containing protein n=1 Tax=Kitasatospora setae (strain ATCC 33774 / DSM 43861 / JCM 3304 / KCC A-0304 / NBRC 14216 / KM-6054) TaxID=452652 RepID=E4N5X0_KITSK|nr:MULTISPECIES: hypothetical protein [Kitasatospora]BAJ26601.1 hypothetical protein KSE_07610 [Kitasatospora setae KM-6054]